MNHPLVILLTLTLSIGAGLIAGAFFAFSNFVMKALAQLPAEQGAAAMQRINVTVLNPVFLTIFMGTALVAVVCTIAAFFPWSPTRSLTLIAAGVSYAVGTFGVTMHFNVPRNNKLARMDSESSDARAYWPIYLREWLFWNHIRTIAGVVSAVCAACALML